MDSINGFLDSNAVSIGNFARSLLAQPGQGRVMGVTSRGFFLLAPSSRVIFVTTEPLAGPVDLILDSLPDKVKAGLISAEVECFPDRLFFPKNNYQINLKGAKTWQPPGLPVTIQSARERNLLIMSITNEILKSGRESTFLPLLKWMVTPNRLQKHAGQQSGSFIQKTIDLQRFIRDNQPTEAGRILDSFLGFGIGLTPSGDDFVWGFLAALNRWQTVICSQFEIRLLNEVILAKTNQKTTSLSATLIECATLGWADANMLIVLDCLFSGEGMVDDLAEKMFAYGSSSGMDAFAGMVVAIKASVY
jgi:hypothetical protein